MRENFCVVRLQLASCWWSVVPYFDPGLGCEFYFDQVEVSRHDSNRGIHRVCPVGFACLVSYFIIMKGAYVLLLVPEVETRAT